MNFFLLSSQISVLLLLQPLQIDANENSSFPPLNGSSASKQCPAGEEFKVCGTPCEPSCDKPTQKSCTVQCIDNVCQCKIGLVRNAQGKCIPHNKCDSNNNVASSVSTSAETLAQTTVTEPSDNEDYDIDADQEEDEPTDEEEEQRTYKASERSKNLALEHLTYPEAKKSSFTGVTAMVISIVSTAAFLVGSFSIGRIWRAKRKRQRRGMDLNDHGTMSNMSNRASSAADYKKHSAKSSSSKNYNVK